MSGVSPMIKKIRQMPGTAGEAGARRFNMPKKGRIRVALALALAAIVVTLICNRDGGKETLAVNDAPVADTVPAPVADTVTAVLPEPDSADKAPKRSRAFFLSCDNDRPLRADAPPGRKLEKKVPDHMMSFGDLRRLVREHGITPAASTRSVVVENESVRALVNNNNSGKDTLTLSLSIDTSLQKYAQQMLRRYKPRYGAVVAIDPATGRVLALASFANAGESMDGSALYLRSVFPAASVFKTIVAAAGIERGGMNARTPIQHYGGHHTLYMSQIQENLKVSREISLVDAFAYSVNPAFARIALFSVDKDIVFGMGKNFGFNESIPFEYDIENSMMYYPDSAFSVAEFASGFNRQTSISPIHGALIAASICEGGVMYRPTLVDSVRSSSRDTLVYVGEPVVWRRTVKERTASELRTLMTSVTRYGTARNTFRQLRESSRYRPFEFGGKTGNVNKLGLGRVDWFIGYARNPNDKSQSIAVGVVTTHGDYWTVQSGYIAAELMKKYIQQTTTPPKTNVAAR